MRIPSALLIVLLPLTASTALAGYENTNWGMTPEEVQKLYPGGTAKTYDSKDGRTSYEFEREIVGYPALVQFIFRPSAGLYTVNLALFPAGSTLNRKAPLLQPLKRGDAFAMVKKLRAALQLKYGAPTAASPTPCRATKPMEHCSVLWNAQGDVIALRNISLGGERFQLFVDYRSYAEFAKESTNGL